MPAILPTAYLPPIAYISAAIKAEEFLIEIQETYRKQTCRNHCRIYGPNGLQILSIPVIKVNGNHTLTRDIRIAYPLSWQKAHWRSIETAYRNSPFFLYYQDYFAAFFTQKYDYLIDLNSALLETIWSVLKVTPQMGYTGTFQTISTSDQRELLVSKKHAPPIPSYHQVFASKFGFISNLSVIDALFNLGPETKSYLCSINEG